MTPRTTVALGDLRFEWREWDPRALGDEVEWTHPGLAVSADGSIALFDQSTRQLVRLDRGGGALERASVPAACAHGLTATVDDGIWIADTGVRVRVVAGEVVREETPGSVFRVDPSGRTTLSLRRPEHPAYLEAAYVPTSVAVAEPAWGGSGDIWVADGYGQALVHRFSAGGEHLMTLDGEEGGGRFQRAHCVAIDARGKEPRLLVTDRSNHRVGVYDLDGRFIKILGLGELRMPSAFAAAGGLLFVAELWSRLAVYDPDDRLVGYLGGGEEAWEEEGWPNRLSDEGIERRAVVPGRFNAPHGLAAGPDGTLYVAEWSLGGRIVELAPAPR